LPAVLILFHPGAETPPVHVGIPLVAAGYSTVSLPYDTTVGVLCDALGNRVPDIVVADMVRAADMFPLRLVQRHFQDIWGAGIPRLPIVALIARYHFHDPDLRLLVDDFLLPPHDPEELRQRVEITLFRRRFVEEGDTLVFAGVRLYLSLGRATTLGGVELDLTRREFDLIRFLMTHRGRGFTREHLLTHVWGIDFEGSERTVDIHIRRLRAKLPKEAAERLDTRRGYGYGFRVDL
jgi:DNA-binding response OmpR family regulator